MKLKILITGTAPNYVARVMQSIPGPNLLNGVKCPTQERAQQAVQMKLHSTYKNIPLELEWEIEAK